MTRCWAPSRPNRPPLSSFKYPAPPPPDCPALIAAINSGYKGLRAPGVKPDCAYRWKPAHEAPNACVWCGNAWWDASRARPSPRPACLPAGTQGAVWRACPTGR